MRILLDEDLPRRLAAMLVGHQASTVQRSGWTGIKNGRLLELAASEFDVFLRMDGNLEFQRPYGRSAPKRASSLSAGISQGLLRPRLCRRTRPGPVSPRQR